MGAVEPTSIVMTVMAARRAELAAAVAARIMAMNAEAARNLTETIRDAADEVAKLVSGGPPRGVAQLVDTWA